MRSSASSALQVNVIHCGAHQYDVSERRLSLTVEQNVF